VFLVFNYEPHYEDISGIEIKFHAFLTLSLDTDAWTTSCPGHLTSGGRTLGTHGLGGENHKPVMMVVLQLQSKSQYLQQKLVLLPLSSTVCQIKKKSHTKYKARVTATHDCHTSITLVNDTESKSFMSFH